MSDKLKADEKFGDTDEDDALFSEDSAADNTNDNGEDNPLPSPEDNQPPEDNQANQPPEDNEDGSESGAGGTKDTESDGKGKRKRGRKKLSPKQKIVKAMRRASGDAEAEMPSVDEVTVNNRAPRKVAISDIAIFLDKPEEEVLRQVYDEASLPNRCNLSAKVDADRVKMVGGQMLKAGRLFHPIQVAEIDFDGRLECVSGRHRLVALALLFGCDAEVTVFVEKMSLEQACDAVIFANQSRSIKARERAQHAVLAAVHGNPDADADERYMKAVQHKPDTEDYCAYMVIEQERPVKLGFKWRPSKGGTGLASIGALKKYWRNATRWHKDLTRTEFDGRLKESTQFLNALVKELQKQDDFDPRKQLGSMPLQGIGRYYASVCDAGVETDKEFIRELAEVLVRVVAAGRMSNGLVYQAVVDAMTGDDE